MEYDKEYLEQELEYPKEDFVYFLLNKGEIVYVGQTTRGLNRIKQHFYENKKEFDSFKIEKCHRSRLYELENYYILKYNPKYNFKLNNDMVSSLYIYTKIKEKFGYNIFTLNYINELLKRLTSNYIIYNGKIKIHKSFADEISEFMINKAEEILNKF